MVTELIDLKLSELLQKAGLEVALLESFRQEVSIEIFQLNDEVFESLAGVVSS